MEKFFYVFLLYFMYCVFGYVLECLFCSIVDKKIVLNRGFLIGPYLPIYGWGAIIIIFMLKRYINDPVALFVMAALISSVLEYFTSYFMEKVFKARWWDYSEKKLNLNGRVCLSNSLLFGIGGVVVMYIINPIFTKLLDSFSSTWIFVLGIIFFTIYFLDTVVSIVTIYKIRSNSISISKDITEEISDQVKKALSKNKYVKRRLLNAFPKTGDFKSYHKLKEILNKHSN